MRRIAISVAGIGLLAGPTVLSFFSGGYFDEARAWAGVAAWVLVVAGIVLSPGAPMSSSAKVALGSLALFGAWTLLSILWAALAGGAYHAGQIVILYLGVLLAATTLTRHRQVLGMVEPVLALGVFIVIGYGLSERLVPGWLHFSRPPTAYGRLEEPITYWNAVGTVAAMGLVLYARLAGDLRRPTVIRALAAAASAPVGMGLYITFSRGGLFAYAAGLLTLLVIVPRREQLRAAGVSLAAAALAAAVAALLHGVSSFQGSLSSREGQGVIALVALLVLSSAAAVAQVITVRRSRPGQFRLPRHAPQIALGLIVAVFALAVVVGSSENNGVVLGGGAGRLTTLQSSRYEYWRVALDAFSDQPIHGVGGGGWAVYWLRLRHDNGFAQDAHSQPIQTLAELGLVGFALLMVFYGGVIFAARRAIRAAPALAGGPVAAVVAYFVHSLLDWDWQMPAVTAIALILAGALLTLAGWEAPVEEMAVPELQASRA